MSRELSIVVGDYPHTAPLFDGRVHSDSVALRRITGYDPVHTAFAAMANEQAFDVSEMAIATYLQARAAGSPIIALPYSLVARFQHRFLVKDIRKPEVDTSNLAGARVGLRSYTQTTGMWVRGIMSDEFAFDTDDATWVTWEQSHVAGFTTPANVIVDGAQTSVPAQFDTGAIDLGIDGGDAKPDSPIQPYFEDPSAAARAWYSRRGVLPVNHLVVVRSELARTEPETVRELGRMLSEARAFVISDEPITGGDPLPSGYDAVRRVADLAIEYSRKQHLIPASFEDDDLILDV